MAKPTDTFWQQIKAVFAAIGHFLASFLGSTLDVIDNIDRIGIALQDAKQEIEDGVQEIKDFKFDPKWKTRVINVPKAIENIHALVEEMTDDFKARLERISNPVFAFKLLFHADFSAGDHVSGLTKTAIKMEQVALLIKELADAFEEISRFADLFNSLIGDVEDLDKLFLQQGNSRRRLTDEAFQTHSPYERIGKLHS